jgi:ABC-type multidrug transport system permease subunit
VDLAILEVEERLDAFKNDLALGITLALFAFFAAFFSLTTVALGVGWLLGHPFWGFLAVSVALILIIVTLRLTKPALVPPSNLLESLRGKRADAEDERSARPASAAVDTEDASEGSSQRRSAADSGRR